MKVYGCANVREKYLSKLSLFKPYIYSYFAGMGFVFNLFNGSPADKIAYEFDLWGKFKCDLVLGCSTIKSYVFIEFEDAKEESIFKKIKNFLFAPSPRPSLQTTASSS